MPTTEWTHEAVPGGSWLAGQPVLTAGEVMFDGLAVYAGQLGEVTEWSLESI